MARYIFDTTPDEDAAIAAVVGRANQQAGVGGGAPESVPQFVARHWKWLVAAWVADERSRTREGRADAYEQTTPQERAQIDAILDKYRGAR